MIAENRRFLAKTGELESLHQRKAICTDTAYCWNLGFPEDVHHGFIARAEKDVSSKLGTVRLPPLDKHVFKGINCATHTL